MRYILLEVDVYSLWRTLNIVAQRLCRPGENTTCGGSHTALVILIAEQKHGNLQFPPTVVVVVIVVGNFLLPVGAADTDERVNVPGGVWVTVGTTGIIRLKYFEIK